MGTTADKELLCTLTNTNSTLTSQLATKDKVIAALQAQLRNNNNNNAQAPATAPAHRQVAASGKHKCYCWTYGVRVSSNHSSINCRDPGEGHKREATRDNKMGAKDARQGGWIEQSKLKVNLANSLNIDKTSIAHKKTVILDSGCSSHYLKRGAYCTNMQKTHANLC
jgi:hypothetical protein